VILSSEKCGYGNNVRHNVFLITRMHFLEWENLRRWSACASTTYEVFGHWRQFEKHCRTQLHIRRHENLKSQLVA